MGTPREVVVAGGGVAGLETVLALRAHAARATHLTVVTADPLLRRRQELLSEPFSPTPVRTYALDVLAEALGFRLVRGQLHNVDGDHRIAHLDEDRELGYDELVIAAGARQGVPIAHAITLRAAATGALAEVVHGLEDGSVQDLVLDAPTDCGWTLPAYELALQSARRARHGGADGPRITVVTHEGAPLEVFYGTGSEAVARELAEAGVGVLTHRSLARHDEHAVRLFPGGHVLPADRVLVLPALHGPGLHGLPLDGRGFVLVDGTFAVPGLDGVHAIGDAAAYPVKQGGLAAQQADTVAANIARRSGVDTPPRPYEGRLRAMLLTGANPLYLSAQLIGGASASSQVSRRCPWWPPEKVASVHLAPFLTDVDEQGLAAAVAALDRNPPPVGPVVLDAPGDHGIELLGGSGE